MEELTESKKKYKHMENVLIKINEKYISLPEDEIKINNEVLHQVVDVIITQMKKDAMFENMYQRIFYGGSYYDHLRVGAPKEFDLDVILKLPVICEPKLSTTQKPGFVKVKITQYEKLMNRPEGPPLYGKFKFLLDEKNFLSTSKVLRWFEGLMGKTLNGFSKDAKGVYVDVSLREAKTKIYLRVVKTGPAFTLELHGTQANKEIGMDVDLVPCFLFVDTQWPSCYKKNPVPKISTFFIVPKRPKDLNDPKLDLETFWRLSFQEQEREIMKGPDLRNMKLTLRFLKKLRDQSRHVVIASYYIKTIFLLELEERKTTELWKMPLSFTFITMIQKYQRYMESKKIPYYWNRNFNLIENIKPDTLTGIGNYLKSMIAKIEKNLDDPFVVCDYLLLQEERQIIESEVVLGKKAKQKLEIVKSISSTDLPDSSSGQISFAKKLLSEPLFIKMAETALKQCISPAPQLQILPSTSFHCEPNMLKNYQPESNNSSKSHQSVPSTSKISHSEHETSINSHSDPNSPLKNNLSAQSSSKTSDSKPSKPRQSEEYSTNAEIFSQLRQLNAKVTSLSNALYDIQERIFQRFDRFERRLATLEQLVKDVGKEKATVSNELLMDDRLSRTVAGLEALNLL